MSSATSHILRRLGILEILFLSGAPMLGGLFACERLAPSALVRFAVLGLLCCLLGIHVRIANDFFDFRMGRNSAQSIATKAVALPWVVLSVGCLSGALLMGYVLGVTLIVFGIAACWMLYVAP